MELQGRLAEAILLQDKDFNTNVRMARSLPLPVQGEGSRPRIDLLVFIVNLRRESSLSSVESSLRHVDQGYCLGKLCFLATEARCGSVPPERLASLRKLAAAHCCPLLFMESQVSVSLKCTPWDDQ
ncbi:CENPM protein, partial [Amia calva]|nr:CENPM protein [Amia calva]